MSSHSACPSAVIDSRLEQLLRGAVLLGALLLLLPGAHGHHAVLGWMPLWLLGMPLASWWALHRFRLPWPPRRQRVSRRDLPRPRNRRQPQAARRRPGHGPRRRQHHAA